VDIRNGQLVFFMPGSDNNYIVVSENGDIAFVGGAGLGFAGMYGYDRAATITISDTGKANKAQITAFAANSEVNGSVATPDHTNDHITINVAGRYWIMCNISALSGAGGGFEAGFAAFINNGATELQNVHSHRDLSGGGGDTGSITISGIADLAVDDTLEIWVWNEDNTSNVIIDDVSLSVLLIGGTT
jgi:hypothetical protein